MPIDWTWFKQRELARRAAAAAAVEADPIASSLFAGTGIDVGALDPMATFGVDVPALLNIPAPSLAQALPEEDPSLEWWEVGLLIGFGGLLGAGVFHIGMAVGGGVGYGVASVSILTGSLWLAGELEVLRGDVASALSLGATIGGALALGATVAVEVIEAVEEELAYWALYYEASLDLIARLEWWDVLIAPGSAAWFARVHWNLGRMTAF